MKTAEDHVRVSIDGVQCKGKRAIVDMTGADFVEVNVDHIRERLWINTSKGELLRLYGMRGTFHFQDNRYGSDHDIPWIVREILWAEQNGSLDALRLRPQVLKALRNEGHLLKEAQKLWTLDGLRGRQDQG